VTQRDLDACFILTGAAFLVAVAAVSGIYKFIGPAGLIAAGVFYAVATLSAFYFRHR
jgi:hypothetical protein